MPGLDADALRPIFPAVLDALTDAIVVVDRSRRVIAANRRYVEVFGAERRQLHRTRQSLHGIWVGTDID